MIDPVTGKLTAEAEKLLKAGKTIPEIIMEARGGGTVAGIAEASDTAAVLETAGALPALGGSVLAFGVGAAIGSEICGWLGIEGCWFEESQSADPSLSGGKWQWSATKIGSAPYWGNTWYWVIEGKSLSYSTSVIWEAAPKTSKECGLKGNPGSASGFTESSYSPTGCGEGKPAEWGGWYRDQLTNRVMGYHSTDTSMPNCSCGTWPSNWSEKLGKELKGAETGTARGVAAELGQRIAHGISPSTVANPYANITVPSCEGVSAAVCIERLEKLGLTPSVAYLNWPEAVIPEPNLDEPILSLEAQAERVQKIAPTTGTKVTSGSTVTVTANPKLANMPFIVPDDPAPGETAAQYTEKRLAPQPGPTPTVTVEVLGEINEDPAYNPSTVVRPSPKPGTRMDPSTSNSVTVQTNPATAPPVGGGSWSPPALHSLEPGPLGLASPCTKFPFGLFCWFGEAIGEFDVTPGCPEEKVPVPWAGTANLAICSEPLPSILTYVRPLILLVFIVGIGFMFARGTRAIGDD